MNDFELQKTSLRDRLAGSLREPDAGTRMRLAGWVHRRRDLGGLYFVDLRDRGGLLQVSFGPDWCSPEVMERAGSLGAEDVILVEGEVHVRPDSARNPEMPTGDVELRASFLEILTDSTVPSIPVYRAPEEDPPSEELRLRHRVLDLRRPELQQNLVLRHRLVLETRNRMDAMGFVEVETPILTKPTPEGARDFLVPSRVHAGEFFALPQSPQIYKQLLMAAGFDRYFQIARCFRDEDLRADRQPEFTQIDVEASFVEVDDILGWTEELMIGLAEVAGVEYPRPFPRMAHAEAMARFGSDRPDLRWDLEIQDWTDALADADSNIIRGALDKGGVLRGLLLAGGASLSRKQIEGIEQAAKDRGAPGLLWAKRTEEGASGPLSRFVEDRHLDAMGMSPGDLVMLAAGKDREIAWPLGAAREAAIAALELPKDRESAWLWVVDFPLFEDDPDRGGLAPNHHPFVMPFQEDLHLLDEDPLAMRSKAYDLVYNGSELGGGSIRMHDADMQAAVLRRLGLGEDEIRVKFGFLLEALRSGAPPHGGIALGMDRIVKEFAGAGSLRDVIAFPKTTAARALFEGAPTPLADKDLAELHLKVTSKGRE
jgi:aspartyl-tRNA synthetase